MFHSSVTSVFCVLFLSSLLATVASSAAFPPETQDQVEEHSQQHLRRPDIAGRTPDKAKKRELALWFQDQDVNYSDVEDMMDTWNFGFRVPSQGIVGGSDAFSGEYPYFVSLERDGFVYCGGSLISGNRVLSAAHCFFDRNGDIFLPTNVRIGHVSKTGGETANVECVAIHPNYSIDSQGVYNDIAVIKLASSSTTSSYVSLNSDTSYPSSAGQSLTAIGFGLTESGGTSTSSTLKKVSVNYVAESDCQASWQCMSTQYHVCALIANKGVCQGDSGGPLLDSNDAQVGITSFGSALGCAAGVDDVYTNVGQYYSWIQGEISSDTCTTSHDPFVAVCGYVCFVRNFLVGVRGLVTNYFFA